MFRLSELVNNQMNFFSDYLNFDSGKVIMKPFLKEPKMTEAIKPYVEIGRRIKAARTALGHNQRVFAQKAGFSGSQVSNWESGLYRPSLDNCITLRETYGLSIDFIIFGNLDALPHRIAKLLEDNPEVNNSK